MLVLSPRTRTLSRVFVAVVLVSLSGMAAPIGIQTGEPNALPANSIAEIQIVTGSLAIDRSRDTAPVFARLTPEEVPGVASFDLLAPEIRTPVPTLTMPLPPAIILFGTALVGLLLLGRRHRSTGPGIAD